MDDDQFKKYLEKAFPGNTPIKGDQDFDFVVSLKPTLSKERESPSSGGGVSIKDSTDNTVSGPDQKTSSSTSSALNANNTSVFNNFFPKINRHILNLRNIQAKQNTSNDTPPENTYNVLVVCSDENKNTDYEESKEFISKRFYDPNKKINTTFLNYRKNLKRYPQDVEGTQYNNYFDMIWFAGCNFLCHIFNDEHVENNPQYSVQRTYEILKKNGILIFTESKDYKERVVNKTFNEQDLSMKVQNMTKMRTNPKNKDIQTTFLGYFRQMGKTDTGTVFYEKKDLLQPTGPSSGNSFSSAFLDPETMTTSTISNFSSIRNSKPEKTFSEFLAEEGGITEDMKTQLRHIFTDPDWTVYDPPADGFCTMHAIYKDLDIVTNDKDYLVDELYRAMKTYMETTVHKEIFVRPDVNFHTIGEYNFRNQDTANETKKKLYQYVRNDRLPDSIQQYYNQKRQNKNQTRIDIQELYNILKNSFQKRTGPFTETPTIFIENLQNIELKKQDFQGQKEEATKRVLAKLKNSKDLGTEIVEYFPYITGRNILYITVLQGRREPKIDYYEGPRDSSKTPENTIIFTWSGHTVLLQNTDEKKNALVEPYIPKFSAQQVTRLAKIGIFEDELQALTRDGFNELMGQVN